MDGGYRYLFTRTQMSDRHQAGWPKRLPLRAVGALTAALSIALAGALPPAAAEASTADWEQRLASEFAALLSRRDTPPNTCVSASVDGESVFRHRETESMVPASLMKLATITAAIELMGDNERFVTTVAVDADDLLAVRDGVLLGDIHLIGGGDPVLATNGYMNRFTGERPFTNASDLAASVMTELARHGIRVVDGAIVGDGRRYGDNERDYVEHTVPDPASGSDTAVWKPSYRSTNLAGPLGGLTLNDGFLRYRADRRAHVRSADPALGAASALDDLLEARGLVIRKRPRAGAAPRELNRVELASVSSPPLRSIAERIGVHSENTAAEMLLKEIGYRTEGSARASAVRGAAGVLAGALGDIAAEIEMVDGSGLSVHNKMTCRAAVALLERMRPGDALYDSLAIAGSTGTLGRCGPAAGGGATLNAVYAKGGLLNNAVAVAGRVDARSRHQLSFAVIANAPWLINRGSCPAIRRVPITAASRFTYAPTRAWFRDIGLGAGDAAAGAVSRTGLMTPCDRSSRRFCPDDPMSRAELAVMLQTAANLSGSTSAAVPIDSSDHPDARAIATVMAAGLMWPCDSVSLRFCPDSPVSQIAAASGAMLAATLLSSASTHATLPSLQCIPDGARCRPATRLDVATYLHFALDAARRDIPPRD